MSGNKIGILAVLLLIVAGFAMAPAVQAYEIADSFRYPLENYVVTGYRFGQNAYHAGEDLQSDQYKPVYPIGKGKVVYSGPATDYAQVIVIEHTLPDNSKIASIYGHLSKKAQYPMVKKDVEITDLSKPIGYIGDDAENGIGGPHLHLGIIRGAHVVGGPWRYWGNTNLAGLSNFYKPSDFLNLVRAVNTNDVYRLSGLGSKAYVSAASMTSCGWRPIDVRLVSSTEMNSHSTFYPQAVCFAPGTFIKRAGNPEISKIIGYSDGSGTVQNRFRQPFASSSAFLRYGGKSDYSNVKTVSYEEYNLHVQGATLS